MFQFTDIKIFSSNKNKNKQNLHKKGIENNGKLQTKMLFLIGSHRLVTK